MLRLPACMYFCVCSVRLFSGGRSASRWWDGVPFSGLSGFLGWFPCVGHFGKLGMGWDSDFGIYIRLCPELFFCEHYSAGGGSVVPDGLPPVFR